MALDEHKDLEGLADAAVLELATVQRRILITFNVRDFAPILREWGGAERRHAGCLLMVGIAHHEFSLIVSRVSAVLARWPRQEDWFDRSLFVDRTGS